MHVMYELLNIKCMNYLTLNLKNIEFRNCKGAFSTSSTLNIANVAYTVYAKIS